MNADVLLLNDMKTIQNDRSLVFQE